MGKISIFNDADEGPFLSYTYVTLVQSGLYNMRYYIGKFDFEFLSPPIAYLCVCLKVKWNIIITAVF